MKVFIEEIKEYDLEKVYSFAEKVLEYTNFLQNIGIDSDILIKPNMLAAFKPEKAVTTHPIILEAVIRLLQSKGYTKIRVGDSPGGTTTAEKVWKEAGFLYLKEKYNIELVNFSKGKITSKKSENFEFPLSQYFFNADAVINIAKYKTHSLMSYTGAVKNLYGLIPGLKKSDYHAKAPDPKAFSKVISELYGLVKDKLVINFVDGILGMEGEGPSAGIPRKFGVLFASQSAPALDYYASKMMGFKLENLPYLEHSLRIDNILPDEIKIDEVWKNKVFPNVQIKEISAFLKILAYSPEFIRKGFRKLFYFYPAFTEDCKKCNVCVDSCPMDVMTLTKDMKTPEIDLSKCIKCMCCHELCPHNAVFVKKSFLAKYVLK